MADNQNSFWRAVWIRVISTLIAGAIIGLVCLALGID